jgi:O-antigen/teichoic acid export membrane protein
MGEIRKQTIQSSFLSYIGFFIGAINTWLFTKEGLFTTEQYGLTQVIISISQILAPLATLGTTAFISRFFPYYFEKLSNKENDMLGMAVLVTGVGALLVFSGCLVFEPFVIRKFSEKSRLVVDYYYWTLVFSFFFLCFTLLESYMGALKKTVLPNFMKETGYRLLVLLLVAAYLFRWINFSQFVIGFCCTYFIISAAIIIYLKSTQQFYLNFKRSSITKEKAKEAAQFSGFVYSGLVVNNIAKQMDNLAIAGNKGLALSGIYTFNQFLAAIIQVPYRGLQAIAGALIAEHWKNDNRAEISRIYSRSSINMLLIGCFLFINIWLNYTEGLNWLGVDPKYQTGKTAFIILSIFNIVELGTGVNYPVLWYSKKWRFEFWGGLFLLALSVPLNIYMARWYGMIGVAYAQLITYTLYNTIRLVYIKIQFNMWPFSIKTIYALLVAAACYLLVFYTTQSLQGFLSMVVRSLFFSTIFIGSVFALQLTPDAQQLLTVIKNKTRKK